MGRVEELEGALREIGRWVDAWDEDFASPLSKEEMKSYDDALEAAGLSITRYNGELIRRILESIGPIVAGALTEEAEHGR